MRAERDLRIRPLALGELIDRSVALTVRHFRALFLAMLAFEAPALALARIQSAGLPEALAAASDPAAAGDAFRRLLVSSVTVLAIVPLLQLGATAAAAAIVAPSLGGAPLRPAEGASRRVGRVAVACFLQALALLAAPALAAAPGAVLAIRGVSLATRVLGLAGAALGALLALLVVLVRLVLAPAAAAVEGRGASALLRSWRLMAPRAGSRFHERPGVRASLVLLATFVLALSVNALASVPRAIATRLAGGDFTGLLPLGPELGISVFEALASAALQPFSLVAVAVFYFERRARTEALDLERWAEELEGSP